MEKVTNTTILIVEDEAAIAMELQSRLIDLGYRVLGPVASSEGALRLVQAQPPDMVLMDIRIQGSRDGIEVAAEIRAQHDLPIIFLTANADASTLQRAKLTEPVGFLTKPFREREVQAMIEMGLYKHQAEMEIRQLNAELENRVAARTAELAAVNAELNQLLSFAAHDLQEPLRPIIIYTQLLAKRYQGQFDPEAEEMMKFIIESTMRLKSLETALQRYAELGQEIFSPRPVECKPLLEKILSQIEPQCAALGATLTFDPLPQVVADAKQLQRVFEDLLDNALKFHAPPRPPRIHVSAVPRTTGTCNEWEFRVQDNGIGIESQYFERIFEIFKRLHPQNEYHGVGIGLTICKRIIEKHGGQIWVESQVGVGTTIFFTLPALS